MSPKLLVQIPRNELDDFFTCENFEKLNGIGEVIWNTFDRSFTSKELKERIQDVDAVITTWGSTPITDEILECANKLQLIAHMAGSVKPIVQTMKVYDQGITVLTSNYAIGVSVSESVLTLILALGHKIVKIDRSMRNGVRWKTSDMEAWELRNRTVGLIGLGLVARELIKLLQPFNVRILGYDPFIEADKARELGVELSQFHDLITHSDIISLHAPKIPETYRMIGKKELTMIRDGALLINTARGDLIDQDALISELRKNRFLAALDVFVEEPLALDSELRQMDNVLVRPHVAGVNPSSKLRIGNEMVEDSRRFFNREPVLYAVKKEQLTNMT
jgi:phosphoglycerate dehydrogenase-like enzyme